LASDAAALVTTEQDSEVDEDALHRLLSDVQSGDMSPDDAVRMLRRLPFADLGFAKVDHHRPLRLGLPEAVYGPGKTSEQCAEIVAELLAGDSVAPVILTRVDDDQAKAAMAASADGLRRGATVVWRPAPLRPERVAVVTAGTSDLPVADECAATLEAHGLTSSRITDVGVAGVHRLLSHVEVLQIVDAVVVIAGMEGALPSVVGGLTGAPVVAVPTSAGYGSSFEGVTALLGMLASCASGLAVVGIDNGYGAACAVVRMLNTPARVAGEAAAADEGLADDG
jgi:hypothetical protein